MHQVAGLISKDTAVQIAVAYQEIARGEKLLEDVEKALEARKGRTSDVGTDLRDVFGRRANSLQLGVPSGNNSHQICDLSYDLALPIIKAHIANKRAELAALSALARLEASGEQAEPALSAVES